MSEFYPAEHVLSDDALAITTEGAQAFLEGKQTSDCPYTAQSNISKMAAWRAGYYTMVTNFYDSRGEYK